MKSSALTPARPHVHCPRRPSGQPHFTAFPWTTGRRAAMMPSPGARGGGPRCRWRRRDTVVDMAPKGLNHLAYLTWDTAATVQFYEEVLGFPLVHTVVEDR